MNFLHCNLLITFFTLFVVSIEISIKMTYETNFFSHVNNLGNLENTESVIIVQATRHSGFTNREKVFWIFNCHYL